jgi:hypothetical protein
MFKGLFEETGKVLMRGNALQRTLVGAGEGAFLGMGGAMFNNTFMGGNTSYINAILGGAALGAGFGRYGGAGLQSRNGFMRGAGRQMKKDFKGAGLATNQQGKKIKGLWTK